MEFSLSNYLNRDVSIFAEDINSFSYELNQSVSGSSFLVIGGAGSIGQSLVKEIFKRNPKKLHVVDISENNLVELVRDIRSSLGYINGDFRTFSLDVNSLEYNSFILNDGKYDYILNLSALKHVRSEKDPFTLMRMIQSNILNSNLILDHAINNNSKKYFCVSTDKAANPVNMMGASKKIMELCIIDKSDQIDVSSARFANVIFSDGSLLHSFRQRILKSQPIVSPINIKRYFISPEESGQLCLLSCILGENRDIFFPKLDENIELQSLDKMAIKFLNNLGYEPLMCSSENEARELMKSVSLNGKWPCYFSETETTGEKPFEEFYTSNEKLELIKYKKIGIVKNERFLKNPKVLYFNNEIVKVRDKLKWSRNEIIKIFKSTIDEFTHLDTGKFLDDKM